MLMGKGQYFSLDAIVASILFILALSTFLEYWWGLKDGLSPSHSFLLHEGVSFGDKVIMIIAPNGIVKESTLLSLQSLPSSQLQAFFDAPMAFNISITTMNSEKHFHLVGIDNVNSKKEKILLRRVVLFRSSDGKEEPAIIDVYLFS
jgi:hypothetical protein